MTPESRKLSRREFLAKSALAAGTLTTGLSVKNVFASTSKRTPGQTGRVIVIGCDGMDPRLTTRMMTAGLLPNLDRLRKTGGYAPLTTSIPPQSPVAWSNFINGAGPGSHGLFDFIHRDPTKQCEPFYSAARTLPGKGYFQTGDHRLQLDFWPFGHEPSKTVLNRQGVPFWNYLDEAGVESVFYDLPANYPPSRSTHGKHKCLSGMGVPDLLGTYGTYQYFSEDGPLMRKYEGGGQRAAVFFQNDTSRPALQLEGPYNSSLKKPQPAIIEFLVHLDRQANAAVVEIQGKKIVLNEGGWSRWVKLDFDLSMPSLVPNKHINGICRFYLKQLSPTFKLYVSPINIDPTDPVIQITEPPDFVEKIASELGPFATTGFQEDHKALSNKVFTSQEFITQAGFVLQERLNLLDYAIKHYDDGLLFFYFSSTDMQSHMTWWDSEAKHPSRSQSDARKGFSHVQSLYQKMDKVIGNIVERYGDKATIIIMSDHGFANFSRQFSLNTWLRDNGYLGPDNATSIMTDTDWSQTTAYGLGINGLYLNLKGRERDGIVEPAQREQLLEELTAKLEELRDEDGTKFIKKVHRSDKVYSGGATEFAPDLIVGYKRGYRASWETCLGTMSGETLFDNPSGWSADHCTDFSEVPGVLFCNKAIGSSTPSLIDLAPSILTEFGLKVPSTMQGQSFFSS